MRRIALLPIAFALGACNTNSYPVVDGPDAADVFDVATDVAADSVDNGIDAQDDLADADSPDEGRDATIDRVDSDLGGDVLRDGATDGDLGDAPPDIVVDAGRTFPAGIGMGVSTGLPPERRITCGVPSTAVPGVTAGAPDRFVLRGRVVTPTGVFSPGEVLITGGNLTCVAARCDMRPGYAGATVIDTAGIIYPGLVNVHDHPQYDFLPPWTPPMLYANSGSWQGATAYRAVTAPLRDNEATHTCAMLKWGEMRSIVSGATSVQGVLNRTCATRTLARNVEYGADFGGVDTHRTNTLGISSVTPMDAATLRAAIDAGAVTSYILHLAEGIDATAWNEWNGLVSRNLLTGALVVIHGTALGRPEFAAMAGVHARLVWSPRSNLVLYGRTTDVGAALDLGINVALAPDWTPTGSPNLLVEMRYAREVSRAALGDRLSARDIFEMATSRAAQVVNRPQIGALVEGRYADVMVIPDRGCDAYESLLDAPVADVRLVMVGGRPLYGDASVMASLPAATLARCETLTVCGMEKRACVAIADTTNELDHTLGQITAELAAFSSPYALVPECPR